MENVLDTEQGVSSQSQPGNDYIVARVDRARLLLAEARDAVDAKRVADIATAAMVYAKRQKLAQASIDYAQGIKVDALTLMGEFLAKEENKNPGVKMEGGTKGKSGGNRKEPPVNVLRLEDMGITKKESSLSQKLAKLAKEEPEKHAAIRAAATPISTVFSSAHVSNNSGNNEWYTPKEYIEAARCVMGEIDLDPASTSRANEVVQAKEFYTKEQNGLVYLWKGKVWLNPPYAGEWIGKFSEKLIEEYLSERVMEAIVLVNNATETQWFQSLARISKAICFPSSRIHFWSPEGFTTSPLQGQAILYLGKQQAVFYREFIKMGLVCYVFQ